MQTATEEERNCLLRLVGRKRRSPTPDEDSLLVKEMNELSVKERETVYDEIHGVAKIQEETPEFLAEKQRQFLDELGQIPKNKRKAYDRAIFLKPSLELDEKFRLMFLRSVNFDAYHAAHKMIQYFEHKLHIFGEELLVSKITLNDMKKNPVDWEAMETGCLQVLPKKDQANRTVWFIQQNRFACTNNWMSYVKYFWYQIMVMLEEESAQIYGMVSISHLFGMANLQGGMFDFLQKGGPFLSCIPFRQNCIHICYDLPALKPVLDLVQMLITKHGRARFRAHFGSAMEVRYAIMTFGIPAGCLPVDDEGKFIADVYQKYLMNRQAKEDEARQKIKEKEVADSAAEFPTYTDIIVGRGRPYQEFPGNIALSQVVNSHRDRYQQTTEHLGKLCIVMEIVTTMQDSGSRFLQRKKQGWEIASETVAREKVRSALRLKNTPSRSNSQNSQSKLPNRQQQHEQQQDELFAPTMAMSNPMVPQVNLIDAMTVPSKRLRIQE